MTYRVLQWASGTVGRHAAKAVTERADMELVGLYSTSADKVGRDVGEVIGVDPLGVVTVDGIADVQTSSADVVIHAPLASLVYGDNPEADLDDICTLLAAGKNVITVVGYMYPKAHGRAVVDRLQDACLAGNSTFHSTGLNPGWMGDLLPLTMTALSRQIDLIRVLEISNFQGYPSPEIMFESMGFGATPEVFEQRNERRAGWLTGLFRESLHMLADGIGLEFDDLEVMREIELAQEDLETAAGTVRAGTVAGQHWRWQVVCGGTPKIVHETVWRMHETVAPQWPVGQHEVVIEGAPRMRLELAANYVSDGLLATAMHAVNAVPAVCVAPAGIKTFLDLPWITGFGAASRG